MLAGVAIMAAALVTALIFYVANEGTLTSYPQLYLLPWTLALAVVMVIPSAILFHQGKFSFADPLVFATWSYFFPAFVVGGIFFSVGLSEPYFLSLIQDASYNLPLTIVIVGLGFIGLSAGYFFSLGERLGSLVAKQLPLANYSLSAFTVPGLLLLVAGTMNTVAAFALGLFGYQKGDEINSYDGIVFLTTLFWVQGNFLLWLVIFRAKKITPLLMGVIILLAGTSLTKILFAGNRGTIVQIFAIIALAYILAGRRFRLKQSVVAGLILSIALIAGMIYGTTFRMVKGSESGQSTDQYVDDVFRTIDRVGSDNTYESVAFGFSTLAERVDIVSTLAVVVSNHEELEPYEEAYGLNDNIWSDLTTFLIPRVVWKDKPIASDARKYSDLYFNYAESSFAITSFGDLLRNYGIAGVPIGMFVLGIILRFIYRSLVDGQEPAIWRLTLYFMLLICISYEGFYGTIIPTLFRVGFTAIVGILLVSLIAKRMNGREILARST